MTWSSDTSCARIRSGSTSTCGILIRSPQIITLATPGTRSKRARIVQYAIIDISVRGTVFEESPIFMTRPTLDTGGIITGGAAQVGIVGSTASRRSCTNCRARSSSVPGLNSSSIDDKSGIDLERIRSSPSTPLNACSSGTVISDSTSSAERPRLGVWISTRGGANSGKTSSGVLGS